MSPLSTPLPRRRGRLLRRIAIVVAGVLATGALASATSDANSRHDRLDLSSIAISSSAQPRVSENAFDNERLHGRTADANTSSLANADCDGCTATATTLAVVYVDNGRAASLDNVATAWNSCTDCRTTSVSVQVVVVRRAQAVTANNRALALNAACEGCHASAAAYQVVMLDPRGKRLSGRDVQALRQWVEEQAEAMARPAEAAPAAAPAPRSMLRAAPNTGSKATAAPQGETQQADLLAQLEQRVGSALGGARTLDRSGEVKQG